MNAKMSEAQSFGGLGFVVWSINAPKRFQASGSERLTTCLIGVEGPFQSQNEPVSSQS